MYRLRNRCSDKIKNVNKDDNNDSSSEHSSIEEQVNVHDKALQNVDNTSLSEVGSNSSANAVNDDSAHSSDNDESHSNISDIDMSSESNYGDTVSNYDESEDHGNCEVGVIANKTARDCNMLYDNSEISLDQSVLNLMNFYVKHNVTKSALQDCLKMQLKILPTNHLLPKTIFKLFQYVKNIAPPCKIIKHYYCKMCPCYIGDDTNILTCPVCKSSGKIKISCFFEFDIFDQIKFLFENNNLASKLRPFKLHDVENIYDIVDGSEYIKVNSRVNRQQYDLTLILNTDGLSLVKSANSHCWPIMFQIAELPQNIRESCVVIAGLWYDEYCKPPMNIFLRPLCLKLRQCMDNGVDWIDPYSKKSINSKVIAPLMIADAPARAQIQNILNFNGSYGCNLCEIETVQTQRVKDKKTIRIYPFKSDSKLRTGKRMEQQAKKLGTLKNSNHIRGVKGYSVLSCAPCVDIGICLIPEYMHSVLLGVVKRFINIWLDKKGPWNIVKQSAQLDDFISNIKPPQSFNRLPRRLTDYNFYKASEFYNFLLFYSLPALRDHLPRKYLQHWMILVKAIFNLLQTCITPFHLNESERLLLLFVEQIESLYGERELTYNTHQLLHLTLSVRRWGPLWATSAFPFENFNGLIAKSVHGNKHLAQEIVNHLVIAQGLQILKNRIENYENTAQCDSINRSNNYEFIGRKAINIKFSDIERDLLLSNGIELENVEISMRAKINREIYTSEIYKAIETNSYTVEIRYNHNSIVYGSIRCFVKNADDFYLLFRSFTVEHSKWFYHLKTKTKIDHIIPVKMTQNLKLINFKNIKAISQIIRVGNYICQRPNSIKNV